MQPLVIILEWMLLLFPVVTIYVTYIHWKWWNLYKPSPLIKHLLIASAAVDVSAVVVAFLAALALGLLPFDLPQGVSTILVAGSLFLLMSVKVYRRISLRALDHPGEEIEQRVETQDQREDREFGVQRRQLEVEHAAVSEEAHAANAEDAYAEGLTAGRDEELKDQREDRQFGSRRRVLEEIHKESD